MSDEAPPLGPKDDKARNLMQVLARNIDDALPVGWGFALLVFPLEAEPGRCNYIANGHREGVIKEMRAFIKRSEKSKTDAEFFRHHPL